jgi:hypothetical protein
MIDDPTRPAPTLDYHRRQKIKNPTALRRYRILLVMLPLLACLLALAAMGYPQPLIMAVIVGPFAFCFAWFVRMHRASRSTDTLAESAWRQHEQRKHELLGVARQIYKDAPLGTWSGTGVNAIAKCTVSLVFNADGTGRYHFSSSGGETLEIETVFQFKPLELASPDDRPTEDINGGKHTDPSQTDGALLIKFQSPKIEGRHVIRYGFYLDQSDKENLKLHIEFEGRNPFPLEMKDFWPFWGYLTREG